MTSTQESGSTPVRLEVVVIPVADPERAKNFFLGLGWRFDGELFEDDDYHLVQITPTGSPASIIFGRGVTAAQPGTFDGLILAVDNIETAREELISRGAKVSEVFHDARGGPIGGFQIGDKGRAMGPDPERRSYATYASFEDTEGNRWVLQEITERAPGRV
jgi:catechol 2,3-dioxygenase-like lactoylglutathione lyase family enzyme